MSDRTEWVAYCEADDCDWSIETEDVDVDNQERYAAGVAELHASRFPTTEGHWTRIKELGSDEGTYSPRTDPGMKACGALDNEKEVQEWLTELFEFHGWLVEREVEMKNHRADLLVRHDDYGSIGVEVKYFKNNSGSKLARAHHQITRRYRGHCFWGDPVDVWAFCPYIRHVNCNTANTQYMDESKATLFQGFFGQLGIGYIDLDRTFVRIDFGNNSKDYKIPVGNSPEYHREYGPSSYADQYADDSEAIREFVAGRIEKYDYSGGN